MKIVTGNKQTKKKIVNGRFIPPESLSIEVRDGYAVGSKPVDVFILKLVRSTVTMIVFFLKKK